MSYSSSSNRCGSCGGSYRSATSSATTTTTYDRCAGGLRMTAQPKECTCQQADQEDCGLFSMSCETKRALRDCAKTAFCEFLLTLSEALCPDGKFDVEYLSKEKRLPRALANSVGQLACSFAHCVPEALCGAGEKADDCLPCDYAVEVVR